MACREVRMISEVGFISVEWLRINSFRNISEFCLRKHQGYFSTVRLLANPLYLVSPYLVFWTGLEHIREQQACIFQLLTNWSTAAISVQYNIRLLWTIHFVSNHAKPAKVAWEQCTTTNIIEIFCNANLLDRPFMSLHVKSESVPLTCTRYQPRSAYRNCFIDDRFFAPTAQGLDLSIVSPHPASYWNKADEGLSALTWAGRWKRNIMRYCIVPKVLNFYLSPSISTEHRVNQA